LKGVNTHQKKKKRWSGNGLRGAHLDTKKGFAKKKKKARQGHPPGVGLWGRGTQTRKQAQKKYNGKIRKGFTTAYLAQVVEGD